ncbi:SRPBCC family protein [Acaryochloris sp. IP29b_bin.137]|uniref:SRPBCC family protein n=1 Tax=Acaryochloris sp. IP29b_bin.137 TaxID=2969217 RepID=UPI0026033A16|nr:SRPBCC family protein [Acaryochloris sp. IP29b_bin.137]
MQTSFPTYQSLDALTTRLSNLQNQSLRRGEAVVLGRAGEYVAQVLIESAPETAWQVLTDFEHLAQFLPNVAATQVLEASAQRTVVEQTNVSQILFAQMQSKIRTENRVMAPGKLGFRLLEGDLSHLQGYWQVLPLSMSQVFVMQVVSAEADMGLLEGSFHLLFRETLKHTLTAIQQEAQGRALLQAA